MWAKVIHSPFACISATLHQFVSVITVSSSLDDCNRGLRTLYQRCWQWDEQLLHEVGGNESRL